MVQSGKVYGKLFKELLPCGFSLDWKGKGEELEDGKGTPKESVVGKEEGDSLWLCREGGC